MTRTILDLVKERVVLLDGGMGTELIRNGFPQGECPESWNVEKPDIKKNPLELLRCGLRRCPNQQL